MNPAPMDLWLERLADGILADHLGAERLRAVFLHLADLGLFKTDGGSAWFVEDLERGNDWPPSCAGSLADRIARLAETEAGFAVGYFLKQFQMGYTPARLPDAFRETPREDGPAVSIKPQPASDLSNLQIVRKVGRQLSPFLEMEKKYLDHLAGKHVGRQEAQLLYQYILGRIRPRGEPRPWEQLSRRRHK